MVALEAHADLEALATGLSGCRQDRADARSVRGHRLLHEDVAVLGDGVLEVTGTEAGRSRQQDHVHVLVDGLLEGIEPDVAALCGHVHALTVALRNGGMSPLEAV